MKSSSTTTANIQHQYENVDQLNLTKFETRQTQTPPPPLFFPSLPTLTQSSVTQTPSDFLLNSNILGLSDINSDIDDVDDLPLRPESHHQYKHHFNQHQNPIQSTTTIIPRPTMVHQSTINNQTDVVLYDDCEGAVGGTIDAYDGTIGGSSISESISGCGGSLSDDEDSPIYCNPTSSLVHLRRSPLRSGITIPSNVHYNLPRASTSEEYDGGGGDGGGNLSSNDDLSITDEEERTKKKKIDKKKKRKKSIFEIDV